MKLMYSCSQNIFTGPKARNLFSISLSVLIRAALKDMRGSKFFTSGVVSWSPSTDSVFSGSEALATVV